MSQRLLDEAGSEYFWEDKWNEQFCYESLHCPRNEICEPNGDVTGDSKNSSFSTSMEKLFLNGFLLLSFAVKNLYP